MVKNRFNPKQYFQKVLVIDASILLKIFLRESGYEDLLPLLKMARKKEVTLIAPPLLLFEFLNVISRGLADADLAKQAFKKLKSLGLSFMNLEDGSILEAIERVSANKKISFYDASYGTLAKEFDIVFLTADRKYYDEMKQHGCVRLFT